jgi:hypothetical protein
MIDVNAWEQVSRQKYRDAGEKKPNDSIHFLEV